jgi:hypothetical protein
MEEEKEMERETEMKRPMQRMRLTQKQGGCGRGRITSIFYAWTGKNRVYPYP